MPPILYIQSNYSTFFIRNQLTLERTILILTFILPTIIKIANSLSVTVDELLCDNIDNAKLAFSKNISFLLEDCTDYEVRVLSDMLLGAKQALRNNASYRDIEK